MGILKIYFGFILFFALVHNGFSQDYWSDVKKRESTLGLEEGYIKVSTPFFNLKLVKASQTVAELSPTSNPNFDFTPNRLQIRDKDSLYHLGDINFRIKQDDGSWKSYSTAFQRAKVQPIEAAGNVLAAADLSNTIASDNPLRIIRFYEIEDKDLVLRFEISNKTSHPVEIGALGVPLIFNNILEGNSLDEAHAQNVFSDPYIGLDAGYLEVKRLSGHGPVLLVLPGENMPFQAYRPLLADPTPRSIVFEGFHEWMPLSKAYAETEWKGVKQWNKPTSLVLKPGEKKNFSIKFVLTGKIQDKQDKLIEEERPVAVGIPGYVIPENVKAKLFLNYKSDIVSMDIAPEGALKISEIPNPSGYKEFQVMGEKWGRARLTINYKDGLTQTIHYKVIKPESEVVHDYGHFLLTKQWFNEKGDPFNRNPSVISYDYETKEQVVQDSRAWIAGLSDEGGAGSWLGAIMKQLVQPDKAEIKKLQKFIDETLWGGIQYSSGAEKYGVKKSMFYYEPDKMPVGTYSENVNYDTWAAWDKEHANDTGRSYNYPHVAAAYWVMYKLARYHQGLVTNHKWNWYLEKAYHTAIAMTELAPYYAQFGQMEGSVFLLILKDLKREDLSEMANNLEKKMKKRADHWRSLNYPFGSEMPWDSTGQEEVFMWCNYFGYDKKAMITLNAILAYMPTMPHWGYNGSARRYWDFLYAGKLSRIERQLHHYGSALNAIPVLKAYRENPDLYLLRVGYGGTLGAISNITKDGFGPSAFHSFPSTLKIDALSGDYGSGFFGYAINTATYITKHENFGWLVFGGNLIEKNDGKIKAHLTTAAKSKIYIAAEELWMTLDAGKFKNIVYDSKSGKITITLAPKNNFTPMAFLRVNKDLNLPFEKIRGAYTIKLDSTDKKIVLDL